LIQAQKFGVNDGDMSEEELGEDSVLLESPLDKLDPYTAFRASLMSKHFLVNLDLNSRLMFEQTFNKSSRDFMRP